MNALEDEAPDDAFGALVDEVDITNEDDGPGALPARVAGPRSPRPQGC